MKKIKVFETFAGIGAQRKALDILKQNNILDYEIVATSEWDIWANISYNSIHHNNKNIAKNLSDEEINSFLSNFTHSNDSKKPMNIETLFKKPRLVRELLYSSYKNSNNQGSILSIDEKKLLEKIKKFDLLTYSFPCQDLSAAGSIHGFNKGMKKGSGTRSGLLWEIERILSKLKKHNRLPKYLLLENVKNMISQKHKDDYLDWLKFLKKIGYNTQTYVLNARDYGVPQNRERVYALSVLSPKNNLFLDTYTTTKKIIEKNIPKDITKEYNLNFKMSEVLKIDYKIKKYYDEALNSIPNKTISRKKMFYDNKKLYSENLNTLNKIPKNNKCYNYNEYFEKNGIFLNICRTITTKQDRNPNAGVIDLKKTALENIDKSKANYRLLTTREVFSLMGFFEEDFEKVKNLNLLSKAILYRQAGNSIVVNVLVVIFYMLAKMKEG
ncbi:DNA (cytosine-5-)-methyltransferase [Spiroplasma tabanidicola]|uniref:Cytosine-specific methyltransferase n=1 Tax=Spiroplasma tabanidicola TaxID=324079 RepID=A0A6I6CA80_9MOLU|nr:DNA (cytosine-5-)-methyltransferase [Spiroplasma tabanidicola]QGS51855.1 DNA (cytosine-5)-methyltransferase 1 [Spiroplasma tabanidicola]